MGNGVEEKLLKKQNEIGEARVILLTSNETGNGKRRKKEPELESIITTTPPPQKTHTRTTKIIMITNHTHTQ